MFIFAVFYCPIAMDLALEGLAEECLRAGLAHLAAVLLPCMPKVHWIFFVDQRVNYRVMDPD
jgi:hypothetical protein